MERACKSCLKLISQRKTYSTDITMLERKPANVYCQMLPYYIGEYEPKQNNLAFESAREIFVKKDDKMVMKRRYEMIYNMVEINSYTKDEEFPENEEIFAFGFQHGNTDKIDNYILIV